MSQYVSQTNKVSFKGTFTVKWSPAPYALPIKVAGKYLLRPVFARTVEKHLSHATDDIYKFLLATYELGTSNDTPEELKDELDGILRTLFITHGTSIYNEFTERGLLPSVPYWLWKRFNWDTDWGVVLRTFRDMPTEAFEKYMSSNDYWDRHKTIEVSEVLLYIQERTDHWGELPKDLLKELLFTPPAFLEGEH